MSAKPSDERLNALETSVAHLQHDLEQMHQVILAQNAEIAALRRDVQNTQGKIDRLEEPSGTADPADERPPHY